MEWSLVIGERGVFPSSCGILFCGYIGMVGHWRADERVE